jgi:hypothetical protein
MRGISPVSIGLGLSLTVIFASCLDLPAKGHDGEPCFENGQCSEGLSCEDGVCQSRNSADTGPKDTGGEEDTGPVVVYPDSGHPKDAGHRDGGGHPDGGRDAAESDVDGPDASPGEDAGDTGLYTDGGVDAGHADAAIPDGGPNADGGADTGAADTGTVDAGDPCKDYPCICDSYCKARGGIPLCHAGCNTKADCCGSKNCNAGTCK